MDKRKRNRLLKEATDDPSRILARKKFWDIEFWPYYLRRCDDILFTDPRAGLAFSEPAPQLAAKIAAATPTANGPDLLLLGHSYRASAYRRYGDHDRAEQSFQLARPYADHASRKALAAHLLRLAYLRLHQKDPECFRVIEEAIAINKRGNLVTRHALGECLVCRARAYVMFNQHGKSFDDYTAALNHLSLKIDVKHHYCVLHNLAGWAVEYGTDEQLDVAYANLESAFGLLANWWGSPYPKIKTRWLMGVIRMRRGAFGRALEILLDSRRCLIKLELEYEVGMISIDLSLLYLRTQQLDKIAPLVRETIAIFRRIGVEAPAQEALDVWRQAEILNESKLLAIRELFFSHSKPPIPPIAA